MDGERTGCSAFPDLLDHKTTPGVSGPRMNKPIQYHGLVTYRDQIDLPNTTVCDCVHAQDDICFKDRSELQN